MAAQNIECVKCTKFKMLEDRGWCNQYGTEVAVDKKLASCPGGEFIIEDEKPKRVDTSEQQFAALWEDFQKMESRQSKMEEKFDTLLNVVRRLTADEGMAQEDITPHVPNAQKGPPEPVKQPVKRKAKKKTKKKVDAAPKDNIISS